MRHYDKLVKLGVLSDMKNNIQQQVENQGLWQTLNKNFKLQFKKTAEPMNNLDPNVLNTYYCEMGFPPGTTPSNTLVSKRAQGSLGDNMFHVTHVSQSDLFKAWKGLRKKLSKKCDTTGVCKFFSG